MIKEVLPLALGSAVSPTMLAVVLLVLAGDDHARARGVLFTIGGTVVLVIVGAVVLSIGAKTVQSGAKHPDTAAAVADLVLGVLLLALAVRTLLHKAPAKQRKPRPHLKGAHPGRFFTYGVSIMAINVTTLVLYIGATKEVAHANVSDASQAIVMAMLIAFAILPAAGPVAAYAVAPGPAARALGRLNAFVTRHARAIGAGLCVVFGAYLLIKGVRAL